MFVEDFFYRLFDPVGFPARWYCGTWSESLGWVHIISDVATGLAYFAIPAVIVYFLSRKKDIPYNHIFWLFAGFIFFCGVEHFIEASIFWHPWYRLAGLAKVCTAIVSIVTVIALIRLLPHLIEIPGKIKSQKKLFSIVQSLPIGILQITEEGKIINANRKTFDLLGIKSLDQIESQSVLTLFPSAYHKELQSAFRAVLKGRIDRPRKVEKISGFGQKSQKILNLYIEKIEDETPYSLLLGLQDLTEIEHSNLLLATTSEYLQALLDNMADGVISLDCHGTIKSINPAIRRIFGVDDHKIIGIPITSLIPNIPQDFSHITKYSDSHTNTMRREDIKNEFIGQRVNGQTFPLNLTLSEMNFQGEKIFSGIIRDISHQKQYEETLKQKNEELMRLNEDRENFVYMVSHDLQEPLRAINNYLQIANINYLKMHNGQETPYFEEISKCIERMKYLIQEVLKYSQIETQKENFKSINMYQLVSDLRDTFTSTDYHKEIFITLKNMLPVKGYQPLLSVLFQNLLSNGIKYNKNNKTILEVDSQQFDDNPDMVLYSVKDNGIGIPSANQSKIFKMFHRLHSAKEFKGLGIGLASCKKIVELHHGKIWVESREGKGSTFYFTLPKFIQDVGAG